MPKQNYNWFMSVYAYKKNTTHSWVSMPKQNYNSFMSIYA